MKRFTLRGASVRRKFPGVAQAALAAKGDAQVQRVIGRPFQKGVSGNPGGSVKGASIVRALQRRAATRGEADAVAASIFAIAKNDEAPNAVAAAKVILDRVDGPVVQVVQETSVRYVIEVPPKLDREAWVAAYAVKK